LDQKFNLHKAKSVPSFLHECEVHVFTNRKIMKFH